MRFAFRVDASLAVGTGHVMRCLTLAEELRRRGAEVLFICRRHHGNLCGLIGEKGFEVECLPARDVAVGDSPASLAALTGTLDENRPTHADWLGVDWLQDAEQTVAVIRKFGAVAWLVVDHYALDAKWDSRLRMVARRVMVIDDLADRPHDCDLLLDQNLYPQMERRYERLVPSGCRTLLGPQYALLRPEFATERANLRDAKGDVRRVLISFGGVDATNETKKAIEAVDALSRCGIVVDVVIGAANPHREEITRAAASRPFINVHIQTTRMADLMASADLAIGGGGVETWERCAVGCPALVIALADNQVPIAKAIDATGAALYLGHRGDVSVDKIRDTLSDTIEAPERLVATRQNCLALVNANGCSAVTNVLESIG